MLGSKGQVDHCLGSVVQGLAEIRAVSSFSSYQGMLCLWGLLPELRVKQGKKNLIKKCGLRSKWKWLKSSFGAV